MLDKANLSHANLGGCKAMSASLREADARYAMLRGAHLQSAHFDGADLRGARLEGANLADCYFLKAQLDSGALQSILKADWRRAHFDPEVHRWLLSQSTSAQVPSPASSPGA